MIVTDANDCSKFDSENISTTAVGIKSVAEELGLEVFPNPSQGAFTITWSNSTMLVHQIEVVNILGQAVYVESIQTPISSHEIVIGNQATGAYYLILHTEKGRIAKKIMLH